jgi:hypothetical protein
MSGTATHHAGDDRSARRGRSMITRGMETIYAGDDRPARRGRSTITRRMETHHARDDRSARREGSIIARDADDKLAPPHAKPLVAARSRRRARDEERWRPPAHAREAGEIVTADDTLDFARSVPSTLRLHPPSSGAGLVSTASRGGPIAGMTIRSPRARAARPEVLSFPGAQRRC